MFLANPLENPAIGDLAEGLRTRQTKALAAGIDVVMAELKDTMEALPTRVDHHSQAFVLLQDGSKAPMVADSARDPDRNADNIKAALYFLGADAGGISRCPDWVYYSHNALGEAIDT